MLNKNQSNRRNVWKYALIIPALVAFIIFFQVQVVAQEKASKSNYYNENKLESDPILITKNTSDSSLKQITEKVKIESDVDLKFKNIKRNNKEEIISISTYFKNQKGTKGNHVIVSDEAIQPFYIHIQKGKKGIISITTSNNSRIALNENEDNSNSDYSYNDAPNIDDEMQNMPPPPTPPTPPNTPDMSDMPTPPTPPNFPTPPNVKAPKDPNDEKAWQKFEADMENFSENWANGPDMKKFEADMKVFEAKMEKWQPNNDAFEKSMKKFEEKMKVYEDKMEAYQEKIRDENLDRQEAIRDKQDAIRDRMDTKREEIEAKREAKKIKRKLKYL